MTDIATNLELLRVKEQQNATIAGLVEALKAQGLTGLDDIETKVQSSPKSRSEKVLKELRDQFTYYRSPLLGSEDFYELVHKYAKEIGVPTALILDPEGTHCGNGSVNKI